LRHTFATDLTRRGVPLNVVQRLLGHTTIQMTIRYAHTPEASLEEAVTLLATARPCLPTNELPSSVAARTPAGMEPPWSPVRADALPQPG